jgi:hypothetical protein
LDGAVKEEEEELGQALTGWRLRVWDAKQERKKAVIAL